MSTPSDDEEVINIYRLSSEKQFNIAKFLPGTQLSLKGTTVKKEMVESSARRRRGQKSKNYVLNDRKRKKTYRAQLENTASRAKYVLFVRKDGHLFYTPVDLYKTAKEVEQSETTLEEAEEQEMNRRNRFEMKVKHHSHVSNLFAKQDVDAEDALPITSKKAKNFGKAKRDVGLGDEERDADFDDVFDDDEEAPVTLQIEDEPEDQEEQKNEEKMKQAIERSEDMESLSASEESDLDDDMDDIEAQESSEDEEEKEDATASNTRSSTDSKPSVSRKRALPQEPVASDTSKKARVLSSAAAVSRPLAGDGVTEADVRAQFEVHGRMTAKSLASKLEDKWKYGGASARDHLFTIVKRICQIKSDPRRPSVKYLVLKE